MTVDRPILRNAIERAILKRGGGLQARMQLEPVIVTQEDPLRGPQIERLPNLFSPYDDRVKLAPDGGLYIRSFRSPTLTEGESPTSWTRKLPRHSKKRWSRHDDVDAAIRAMGHIAESYDPQEGQVQNTLKVIDAIKQASERYQSPGITEEGRREIAEHTAQVLVESGFADAQKAEKLRISKMVLQAAQRDRLGRINSPRSRLVLSNAWVALMRELVVNRITQDKYQYVLAKLELERGMERFYLEQTASRIEAVLANRDSSPETARGFRELRVYVARYNSPRLIPLRPYSQTAALVRYLLLDLDENSMQILERYLGPDAAMYDVEPFKSLTTHAKMQRIELVDSVIRKGLEPIAA